MRRLVTTSITMLVLASLAPACGVVLGIDTDRPVVDPTVDAAAPSPSTSTSTTTEGGAPSCGAGCGQDAACVDGVCVFRCAVARCSRGTVFACPPGATCRVECGSGSAACRDVTCQGGESCTFACTSGDCKGAVCDSASCVFQCDDDGCGSNDNDLARCTSGVKTCETQCAPGAGRGCSDGVCCDDPTSCLPRKNPCSKDGPSRGG